MNRIDGAASMKLKKKQNKRLLVKCLIILFNSDILEAFTVRLFKKKKRKSVFVLFFFFLLLTAVKEILVLETIKAVFVTLSRLCFGIV